MLNQRIRRDRVVHDINPTKSFVICDQRELSVLLGCQADAGESASSRVAEAEPRPTPRTTARASARRCT